MRNPLRRGRNTRSGLTLLELLIVLVIVALLITLGAGRVRRIRTSVRDTSSLANLRTHAAMLTQYAADHRDSAPAITDPRASRNVVRAASRGYAVECSYFEASWAWYIPVGDAYYPGGMDDPSFRLPGGPITPFEMGYTIPCVFFAEPGYWDLRTRLNPPAQFRSVALSETTHPSLKAFVVSGTPWFDDPGAPGRAPVRAAFVDGHGAAVPAHQAVPEIPQGDGPAVLRYGIHSASFQPLLHTERGVHGRDIAP